MVAVVGEVRVARKYYRCRHCGSGVIPLDDWAGVCKGHLTIGARRLACLAASSSSFDKSSKHLHEFCGLSLSDQTIRRVAEEEGLRAFQWLDTAYTATTGLLRAPGQTEFSADGIMVNTRKGWKEMRVTSVSKRKPGTGVEPCGWEQVQHRHLPPPEARLVTARFADCEEMGEVWQAQAARLGLEGGRGVSVLCDGAKWIWAQVEAVLPHAEQVLDVFHVSEHVHACAGVLHGEHTTQAATWAGQKMMDIVRHGSIPMLHHLEGSLASWDHQRPASQQALTGLLGYVRDNRTRMNYADRLRRGLPIGNGQVEGTCKTVVGRRLKLNSARWLNEGAQHVGALSCLDYCDLWEGFWASRVAA